MSDDLNEQSIKIIDDLIDDNISNTKKKALMRELLALASRQNDKVKERQLKDLLMIAEADGAEI